MLSPQSSLFMALCALLIVAGAILGVLSALQSGPGWDDALEIKVMNREIKVGASPGLNYEQAKAAYGDKNRGHVFYGVAMQYAAHAITSFLDGRPWGSRNEAPNTRNIAVRHVLTMLLALFGAGVLAVVAAVISQRVELGFSVGAVLMSTPVFIGHSAMNVKDVPVGIGITLFSCGAALLLLDSHRARRFEASAAAMIVAGTFLAVGTRAGAIALVGFEAAIICALLASKLRIRETVLVVAGLAVGTLVAAFTNPFGRKAPIQWLWESAAFSPSQPVPTTLFGQTVQSTALPWWYVPGWILVEYPIPFLVLAGIGAIAAINRLRNERLQHAYPWVPFLIQGLVLSLVIVLAGAPLYDRLRHLFFIVPPLCLLAGFGLYYLVSGLETGSDHRKRALAHLAGVVFLVANFAATLLWQPYQYAYLNAVGRLFPEYTFDTDYWGLTVSESVDRMKKSGVKAFSAGPSQVFASYKGDRTISVEPHITRKPRAVSRGFYYVHSRPSWHARGLPNSCRTLFKIRRQGVILGVGGECRDGVNFP